MNGRRIPVDSSSLASVMFSAELNVLWVNFRNGLSYEYFGVPQHVFDELVASASKGSFLNRFIRNRFPYRRLGGPET